MWWCMVLLLVPWYGYLVGLFGGFRVEVEVVVVLGSSGGSYYGLFRWV